MPANRIYKTLAHVYANGFRTRLVDLTVAAKEYAAARASREPLSPRQQTRVINKLRAAAHELWAWDEKYRDCPISGFEVPVATRDLIAAALAFGAGSVEISDVAEAAVEYAKDQTHRGG